MKVRSAIAAASVLGLAAGPLLTAISADAGPVAVSQTVVLNDGNYVDVTEEALFLVDDLEAGGHTVSTIDDITDEADFLAKLDAAEAFVVPELEEYGGNTLTPAEVTAVQDFVDGGGRIVFFGSSDPTDLIGEIFGFAIAQLGWCDGVCDLTAEAADTELADGPPTLAGLNGTTSLDPATLPAGTTTFYGDAAGTVSGAVSMPYGDGAVVFLGWDWFPDSSPVDAEKAEWASALDLAVSQPEVTATSTTAGEVTFTSDSPSTQPVFVSFIVDGVEQVVTIAPKTTTTTVTVAATVTSASFTVPGWGIGEGDVAVASAAETPTAETPAAEPVPAPVPFTG